MYAPPPPLTDADRCPHCGARAVVSPNAALFWICGVCGGARVRGLTGQADARTVKALVEARQGRASAFGFRAGAVVVAVAAAMALTIAAVVGLASRSAGLVLLGVAALLAIVAWVLGRRGRRAATDAAAHLDVAYAAAAETIARAKGGVLTSSKLAGIMQIDASFAERILTRLSVSSRASVDVGDDAELRYRIEDAPLTGDALPANADSTSAPAARGAQEPR